MAGMLGQSYNTLNNQKQLNKQYTGNEGYQNAINQGLQGAAVTANQAGAQAQQAARNAGMSKAQAAAMGTNQAANQYGQNFANQQSLASQLGTNALSANQNLYNQQFDRGKYGVQMAGQAMTGLGNALTGFFSDERLKEFEKGPDILDSLDKIDAYLFKYTDKAQKEKGVDDDTHVGVMAQDLEKSPITAESVKEDEEGTKYVDTNELTMTQMAIIAELWKEVKELKAKIGDR